METLQTVDAKNQENGVSTTNMNVSPKLIHSNDTATETEDIETEYVPKFPREISFIFHLILWF